MWQRTERTRGPVSFTGGPSIIGQDQPLRRLAAMLAHGMIPHALLFTGIDGVGKRTTATRFAMAYNCTGCERLSSELPEGRTQMTVPCEDCRSCRKIASGNHPDIIHVAPSGNYIKISQIRALAETLTMKPYEARTRVAIVSEAQCLNAEAANALLKLLEEPPEGTLLILTSTRSSDLLPTVVSRCQQIAFRPVARDDLAALLVRQKDIPLENAKILAVLANGSVSQAHALCGTDWIHRRNWLITELDALPSRSLNAVLAFAEILSRDKEAANTAFDIIISWLRDLIVYPHCPHKIINRDLTEKIRCVSKKSTTAALLEKIEAVDRARKAIGANANLRLTLEILSLKMAGYSTAIRNG